MEIIINESESHIMNIPIKINVREFNMLVYRLNDLAKVFSKFGVQNDSVILNKNEQQTEKRTYKPRNIEKPLFMSDRNEAVRLLHMNYYGSKDEKNNVGIKYNSTWQKIQARFFVIKNKFDIKANEVGLTRFPRKGEKIDNNIFLELKTEVTNGATS